MPREPCSDAPPAERTRTILIRTVAETGSTNDDLAASAREGAAEGSWLRAERQTGGRGRQGRSWHSPSGNLHASTLVRIRSGDPPVATLALTAAVALQEVVQAYAPSAAVHIKWPNDLVAERRKLAGILLERHDDAVIVGFGVNLAAHPSDPPAADLREITGHAPDAGAFLETLAETFSFWLSRWRGEGLAPVRLRWLERAHPVGTPLRVTLPAAEPLDGLFDGLDDDGALRIRLADGSARVIHAGDIFLI